jgi:hypothetical protein
MRRRTWARCIAQKDENCTVTVCRVRPPRPRLPYGPITLYPYPAISTQAQEANSIRRSGRRRARGPPPPSMTQPGVLGNSWTSSHLVTRCLFPAAYGSLGATLRCTQLRSFPTPIFFFSLVGLRTTLYNVVLHVYPALETSSRGLAAALE